MSNVIHIPLYVVYGLGGGATLLVLGGWIRRLRPQQKKTQSIESPMTGKSMPLVQESRPEPPLSINRAPAAPPEPTSDELLMRVARATTPEECGAIFRHAPHGSTLERTAADKHDSFLAADLSSAATLADCFGIEKQALGSTLFDKSSERMRQIIAETLPRLTTSSELLDLYEIVPRDHEELITPILARLYACHLTLEEYGEFYNLTPSNSDVEAEVVRRNNELVEQHLASAATIKECEGLKKYVLGDADNFSEKIDERIDALLRQQLALITSVDACFDLFDMAPTDDDGDPLTVGLEILEKAALLAQTSKDRVRVYDALPGDDEDEKGELATTLVEQDLAACTTTDACLELCDAYSDLLDETVGKILSQALLLATSYEDCDEVESKSNAYNDEFGPSAELILEKKIQFMDTVDECVDVITSDEVDEPQRNLAILRAADLIRAQMPSEDGE